MIIAQSKLTARGLISVPVEVRRRLGVGPGSVVVWEERHGELVVRRAGRYSSEEIHSALFGDESVAAIGPDVVKDGIRKDIRRRHARR
jgi:bifunctional DNA-binding transcriptional regulator/antitoxin component of YhaV-PrlF toxin-antitoxin module